MLQELTLKLTQGEHLSVQEGGLALRSILSEGSSDAEIGRFLTVLAKKGETEEEIAGFARVMRQHSLKISCDSDRFIDTAGTGGGIESFNISTAAAFVISGAGLPVAKHGNRAVTSRSGSADVLTALGVNVGGPISVAEECLNTIGMGFLFAPSFHPAMKRVVKIRQELGQRTIFNLLGPLTNPANAPYQLIGVYSPDLTSKLAGSLSHLDCRKAWVVHSDDGMDELSTLSPSTVAEVDPCQRHVLRFDPAQYGFRTAPPGFRFEGGSPEENAVICRQILSGTLGGPHRDVVVANSAAALHIASDSDFRDCVKKAKESIDSGAALEKLTLLIEKTQDA